MCPLLHQVCVPCCLERGTLKSFQLHTNTMSRTVLCRKYGRELEGLDAPPMPGAQGQHLYETISKQAWNAWMKHQTTLINEKFLNLRDASTRSYLNEQMERFFDNREVDQAEGYAPPDS